MYPDKSVDMILCDLPYGVTNCRWDSIIPLESLWKEYKRIIKTNGAIVLTSSEPFTSRLIMSNQKMFRYCWYWNKNIATGFAFAKKQPLRCIEIVCVFYRKFPTYNPQGIVRLQSPTFCHGKRISAHNDSVYRDGSLQKDTYTSFTNYPRQLLNIKCERGLHPTQKPLELFEYLIKTYTNPGDLVLDTCMGSGTTAIACINTGRDFSGFEKDDYYFKVAQGRIDLRLTV